MEKYDLVNLSLISLLNLHSDEFCKDQRQQLREEHRCIVFEEDKVCNLVSRTEVSKMNKLKQSVKDNKCF
jgi:hypothetical protein